MTKQTRRKQATLTSLSVATKRFTVFRKSGALVIECQMNVLTMFERDLILNAILPGGMVRDGERQTFEIKKVKKKNV